MNTKINKNYVLVALFSLLLIFSGCNSGDKSSNTNKSTSSSTVVSSSAESSSSMRTVTGTDGVKVEIPKDVKKVGASIGAFAQVTAMLGGEDELVVTTKGLSDMYKKVWPDVNPGNYDVSNAESIIESGAEVVYGPNVSDEVAQQLNQAGIAVVNVGAFSNAEELKKSVTLIADILGNDAPKKAEKFNDYYDETIDYVEEKTKDIPESERVKVLNLRYSGDNYTTVNSGDISSFYAEAAGGNVVSKDFEGTQSSTSMVVNTEQIIDWAPEVIYTMGQAARDQIVNDPSLASVPAVKNGKVYTEPSGTYPWSVRSAEGALMPLFLAKIMYPDEFEDLSLEEKVKEFYEEFYDYKLTDDEVKEILAGEE